MDRKRALQKGVDDLQKAEHHVALGENSPAVSKEWLVAHPELLRTRVENFFQERASSVSLDGEDDAGYKTPLPRSALRKAEEITGVPLEEMTIGEAEIIGRQILMGLVRTAEDLAGQPGNNQVREAFLNGIIREYFTDAGSLTDLCSVEDRLRFFRATEDLDAVKELRDQAFTAASYDFSFLVEPEHIHDLLANKNNSSADRLGFWNYIRMAANANEVISHRSRLSIREALESMDEKDLSYFESVYRDTILDDISEREAEEGGLTKSQLKIREDGLAQYAASKGCYERIKPSPESSVSDLLVPVARDAVASVNAQFSLQGVGMSKKINDEQTPAKESRHEHEEMLKLLGRSHSARFSRAEYQAINAYAKRYLNEWVSPAALLSDQNIAERLKQVARTFLKDHPDVREVVDIQPLKTFLERSAVLTKTVPVQEATNLIRELHRPLMKRTLEERLGLTLNQLSLREQLQLLNYMASVDAKTAKDAFEAMKPYGIAGARAFISCEYGKHVGDVLVGLAKQLDKSSMEAILQAYGRIVDLSERSSAELTQQVFISVGQSSLRDEQMNEELLGRAKEIIANFGKKGEQSQGALATAEVLAQLKRYEQDIVLFASVFKIAFKGQEKRVNFNEIKGMSLRSFDPAKLDASERVSTYHHLKATLMANWSEKGVGAAALALHGLDEGFESKLSPTTFYELKKGDDVAAFVRFDDRPDLGKEAKYAGSFNVDPALRGSAIGGAFFHQVLAKEGKEHPIFAHVLASDRVGSSYVEDFGFTITGVEEEGGAPWFVIERPADNHVSTDSRESPRVYTCAYPGQQAEMMNRLQKEFADGYVVTSYKITMKGKAVEEREFILKKRAS